MASHKKVKNTSESLFVSYNPDRKAGLILFFVSFALHGLVFTLLIFVQDFKLPKPLPQVVQVDLVSFAPEPMLKESPPPPPAGEKVKDEGIAIKQSQIKKIKSKIQHKKPDISLKTKPKNLKKLIEQTRQKKKEPVKKKTKEPTEKPKVKEKEAIVEKPSEVKPETPDEHLGNEDQQKIAEALRKIKEKLKTHGAGQEKTGEHARGIRGKKGVKPLDLYHLVIEAAVKQNWVFNERLARMNKNLEVVLLIKILQSGEIRDIIYETRSGNRYLDESAKKAIIKINPLPPLPAGQRSYTLGLIFTPEGLK